MGTPSKRWSESLRSQTSQRWLVWFGTVILVACAGMLLLRVLRQYPEGVHAYFATAPRFFGWVASELTVLGIVALLFRLLSPRLAHIEKGTFWKYPPYWSAVAIAAVIVFAADLLAGLGPGNFQASFWEWLIYGGGSVAAVAGYRRLTTPDDPAPAEQPDDATPEELVSNWPRLEQWLQREIAAEDDLLGNRRVAQKLADYLIQNGGTIGLVGPFGCGKTSVVKWVREELEQRDRAKRQQVWVCVVNCWGFEDSTSAIQQILSQAVQTVGRRADCFSIRHLPESYRKTFSAGGDWVRNLTDLVLGTSNQIEQFKSLSGILKVLKARLVIVVEDLDRTNSTRFDRQEVLALLQRLKENDDLSFILTGSSAPSSGIDFARLCDHIELLREFEPRQVSTIVRSIRNRCLTGFHFIDTHPTDDDRWNDVRLMVSFAVGNIAVPTALARLLRTPRGLKHTLRRTYQAWERLHGEVDFDHLLVVNALRHGAPEAFDFLWQNWNQLQTNDDTAQRNRVYTQLRAVWAHITEHAEWDRSAVEALVDFLLPGSALLDDVDPVAGHGQFRLQGITEHEGRYWRRIVHEELEAGQVRDQEVLRDIRDWYTNQNLGAQLVEGLVRGGDYAGVWEHFAGHDSRWAGPTLLCLAGHLLDRFRTTPGARRTPNDPPDSFLSLWRLANRRVERNESSSRWLEEQIRQAMSHSLQLVLDLYYYWASPRNGIVRLEDRRRVRQVVLQSAQEQFRTGANLIQVAHPQLPYDLYQLVFPPGEQEEQGGTSAYRGPMHWAWLGPILLDALQQQPRLIAPKVGHLIAHGHRRVEDLGTVNFQIVPERLQGMFGTSADEVIQLLAQERDRLAGPEREFLDQIVRSVSNPTGSQPTE